MSALYRRFQALIRLRRWLDLLGRSSLAAALLVFLLTIVVLTITGGNQIHFRDVSATLAASVFVILFLSIANIFSMYDNLGSGGLRRCRFYGFRFLDYFGLALLFGLIPALTEALCLMALISTPLAYQMSFPLSFALIWLLTATLYVIFVKFFANRIGIPTVDIRADCPSQRSGAIRFYLVRSVHFPSRRHWRTLIGAIAIFLGTISPLLRLPHLISYLLSPIITGGILEYLLRAEWKPQARFAWDFYSVTPPARDRAKLRLVLEAICAYLVCTLVVSLIASRSGWVSAEALLALTLIAVYELFNAWALTLTLSSLARIRGRSLSDFQVAIIVIIDLVPVLILLPMLILITQERTRKNYA